MIHATEGLLEALLDFAREAEPESVTIPLATTPAGDLEDSDLDPETPVFTDFYFPDAGRSVSAVFGIDLATPVAQTAGRFVSHPQGRLGLERTDDLHAVVFVAVAPWDLDSIAAFTRYGARQSLDRIENGPEQDPWDDHL